MKLIYLCGFYLTKVMLRLWNPIANVIDIHFYVSVDKYGTGWASDKWLKLGRINGKMLTKYIMHGGKYDA